jgi:hypothetical protein
LEAGKNDAGEERVPDLAKFEARDDDFGGDPTKAIAGLSLLHTIQAKDKTPAGTCLFKIAHLQIMKTEGSDVAEVDGLA